MVYVYKKSDKEYKNPIHLSEGVRFKSLWNKAQKIESELRNYFLSFNLMFDGEEEETRQELDKAIDCLIRFRENLKLKDNMTERKED